MRLSKLLFWMLLCGAMALVSTAAQAQATNRVAGRIVVVRVQGTVTATNLTDNAQRTLANNDTLTQQMVVKTGAGSSAILVFSNGATMNLGADSTLSIDEFLQDPFEKELSLSDLKEEPTSSTTKLNLSRGELVGNVKHLHEDKGSTFTVNTPVGAAGIRGTTFRIVFRPDASGQVFFTLSTADGRVLFEAPAGGQVSVETGKEVSVTVDVNVDATTGTVTVTAPPVIEAAKDMSAATQAQIATAAQQIVEAASSVILNSTPPSGSPSTETPKDEPKKDEAKKDEGTTDSTNNPLANPNNTTSDLNTPAPSLTPGAGK